MFFLFVTNYDFCFQVLSSVTSNKMCVENIADSSVAILLLLTLDTLPSGAALVIEILHALASNGKIVKQLLSQGNNYYPFLTKITGQLA